MIYREVTELTSHNVKRNGTMCNSETFDNVFITSVLQTMMSVLVNSVVQRIQKYPETVKKNNMQTTL